MRNALIAILIGILASTFIINSSHISTEYFSRNIRMEQYNVKFYKNNVRIMDVDTLNPMNDYFDGIGELSIFTPKHKVKVSVGFDIYGHINLDQIDSCFEIFGKLANDSSIPHKIHIIKYVQAVPIFQNNGAALAGISKDGKAFIISEVALSNQFLFIDTIDRLFKSYVIYQVLPFKFFNIPAAHHSNTPIFQH